MKKAQFEAELIQGHKSITAVIVPFDPEQEWSLKPIRLDTRRHGWLITGTANGVEFDGYIGQRWGRFFIIIDRELRKAADVSVGDTMKMTVKPTSSLQALAKARTQSKLTTKPGTPRTDVIDPPDIHEQPARRNTAKSAPAMNAITFDTVRDLARDLAGIEESTTYGWPALKLKGKLVAWMPVRKEVEPNTLAVRMNFEQRDPLVEEAPDTYYVTNHYLDYPAVLVRLSQIDRESLRDILRSSWRYVSSESRKRP